MSVTVRILGVALFKTEGDDLDRVYFPDAHLGYPRDYQVDHSGICHHDHSVANAHFPWLLRNGELPINLYNSTVVINPREGDLRWAFSGCIEQLADLRVAAGKAPLVLDPRARPSTTILLHAPAEGSVPTACGREFIFDEQRSPKPVRPEVRFVYEQAVDIEIRYPSGPMPPMTVPDGTELLFWHADVDQPIVPGKPIGHGDVDDDFKWLYALLRPKASASFPGWCNGNPLPAPWFDSTLEPTPDCPDPRQIRTPSVSTCFPGVI